MTVDLTTSLRSLNDAAYRAARAASAAGADDLHRRLCAVALDVDAIVDAAAPPAAPDWTICDRIIDISDMWREIADPENVRGAECLAYLDRDERIVTDEYHCDRWQTCFRLRGVSVSDDNGTQYYPRSWVEGFFGGFGVWAIEVLEMETVI